MTTAPASRPPGSVRVADALARRAGRLRDAAVRCETMRDPDAVHDLRVASRRLDAALDVWRGALRAAARRELRRRLRRLRRVAAAARDGEVAAGLIANRLRRAPSTARPALRALRAAVTARRDAGRAALAPRPDIRRLATLPAATTGLLARRANTPEGFAVAHRLARARVTARARAATVALAAALAAPTDARLHRARVAIKKWRYAAEALAPDTGGLSASDPLLRDLQRWLGEIHDRAVLRDLLLGESRARGEQGCPADEAALAGEADVAERARRRRLDRLRSQGALLAGRLRDGTPPAD